MTPSRKAGPARLEIRDRCPSMRRAALTHSHVLTRTILTGIAGFLIAIASPLCVSTGQAETMSSALARAYAGNPDLNQRRAAVRATDENLPRATSGWRPKVSATGLPHLQSQSASTVSPVADAT
jgi:outer membrane protein TolC